MLDHVNPQEPTREVINGAEEARRKVKIALRKKMPCQSQLFHRYSSASEPVNRGGVMTLAASLFL